MKRRYKLLIGVAAAMALVAAAFGWLLTTQSGARWLYARAEAYLPEALAIESVSGTLVRGITADAISWHDDSIDADVERVFVHVKLLPLLDGRVEIEQLDVAATSIEVATTEAAPDGDGGLPDIRLPIDLSIADGLFTDVKIDRGGSTFEIETVRIAGRMEGSDLEIALLTLDSDLVSLSVDGRLRLSRKYRASANVVWRWTTDREFAGHLRISGDVDGYEIEHVLDAPVAIQSRGTISLDAEGVMANLRHTWQSLEWPVGEEQVVSAGGALTTAGNLESVDVTLNTSAQTGSLPETQISLTGSVDPVRLRIDAGSAQNELGVIEVAGEVRWTPEVSLDFRVTDVDPARLSDRLAGRVGATGHVEAALDGDALSAALRIDSLDGQLNGSNIGGSGSVGLSEDTLSVTDAEIVIGDSRFSATGRLGDTVSIDLNFEVNALDRLFTDAAGSFEGTLGINGPRATPDVRLSVAGSELVWTAYRAQRLSIDANVRSRGLTIVDIRIVDVGIGEEQFDVFEASASGSLERHRVSVFAESGTSNIEIGGVGGIEGSGWLGEISTLDVASDRLGRWNADSPSTLSISADGVELGALCVVSDATAGRFCAGGAADRSGNATVQLDVDSLPIAALPLGLPETTQVAGSIDARIDASIAGDTINGDGSVTFVDAGLSSIIDGEELTIAFTEARADASIRDNQGQVSARFELEGGGAGTAELRVDDVFDVEAPVNGRATLSLSDAGLFAFLLPALSDPYGEVEGTLSIGGSLAQPEFAGAVDLSNGRFALRNAGIVVVDVNARIEQQSVGRLRLSGSGRSGEGALSIEGETILAAGSGIRSEIRIRGDNFELLRLPDWQLAASPDIGIVFDDRMAAVTGDLHVPRATINLREIPETAESVSSDTVVHRTDGSEQPAARRIGIDIGVSLGEEVRFSGFGLETGLGGALRVRGGTDTPYTGVGRLTLDGGRYEAYGQELEIEIGNLIFNGPLEEPQLDVRAVRRAGDVTAGILLTGTPTRLRSELVSDPRMSDAEALSYLLTGRSLENATNAGEGDTLNQAAFALGLSGAGSIVSQIRGGLGLDTLSVEGGASSSRIVAGKRFGERLFVEYGYGLIDQLGTLLLRYQLNERLVLESRTGETSNLDLVYRVRKR